LLEATFLDDRVSIEDARAMGHIHLDELIARPELLAAKDIVLHHFSARYTAAEVSQLCQRRIPDAVRARVRILGTD
jgi:ribonuclease Z